MKSQIKIIKNEEDRSQFIHNPPWVTKDGKSWQPCPPKCYRLQSVDLKHNAYRVWTTNGVFHTVILLAADYLTEFFGREKVFGATILDDSGIGLENLIKHC